MKKTLHRNLDFQEIKHRINLLKEDSGNRWGSMNAAQMFCHCERVLKIPLKELQLPEINILFRTIGLVTKKELHVFNNGIPANMPTFKKLVVNFDCDFSLCRENLLKTLDRYVEQSKNNNLPDRHSLFGKMEKKDWGFLEYKHLDHHLKQFGV